VTFNRLECRGNYSATSNEVGTPAGPHPAHAHRHCTKCNSPPINGQCTNNLLLYNCLLLCGFNVPVKGLRRNIHLLYHCSKIFSWIILQRIKSRTEEILTEAQVGFRAKRSTIDQIFTLRQLAKSMMSLERSYSLRLLHRLSESF